MVGRAYVSFQPSGGGSLMSSLELLDFLEETDQVTDWYMLGVYLKMPHGILDDIEKRLSTRSEAMQD